MNDEMTDLRALLFDKDGTLFDFQATWGGWAADLLQDLAGDDPGRADDLAERIRFDRIARRFHPDSPVIAGTTEDAVERLLPALPHFSFSGLLQRLVARAEVLEPVEAVPLAELLTRLRAAGFVLGVATNDAETAAAAQFDRLGILDEFDLVLGADSGHGAKPGPGQCLAFAAAAGLAPRQVAMIGDSSHDLKAGKAAGMLPVGVLTGPATARDLSPFAQVILPDIGHLPAWLGLS